MIEVLKEEFDFSIPFAVCKASLKRIGGLSRTGEEYTVNVRELVSKDFEQINNDSLIDGKELIRKLTDFALEDKRGEKEDDGKWIEILEAEFIKYILDRQDAQELQYGDLISRFCLNIEKDGNLQRIIERIREGSILYSGLCYNIIETGSLSDNITLYLDTEILFYLAGYNGQLSQRIVLDLMDQVKKANKKVKKITLTYFNEVKEEIDRYFTAARNIVAGKGGIITSRAMASIVNGCEKESDVLNKQSDFYYLLENSYGVKPDKNKDTYYSEDNYIYNLESQGNEEEDRLKTEEAMRFISHINVLRKGNEFTDFMKSQFLIITETRRLIEISDEQKPHGKIGYALPVNSMTNMLWLKLGGVFGKGVFPSNVSIAVKARMALGKSISSSVNREYTQTVLQYKEGAIQEDQAIARLLRLQDKIISPENISDANIDDLIDFSPESLKKYEEALRQRKIAEEKKDRIISDLELERKNSNDTIIELQKQNELKESIIKEKEDQIQGYIDKEKKDKQNKENRIRTILNRLKAIVGIEVAFIAFWALEFLPDNLLLVKICKGGAEVWGLYSGICTIWPQANVLGKYFMCNKAHSTDKANYKPIIIRWAIIDVVLFIFILVVLLKLPIAKTSLGIRTRQTSL